jgi:thiol-disulfide isomerase/thioredoxin
MAKKVKNINLDMKNNKIFTILGVIIAAFLIGFLLNKIFGINVMNIEGYENENENPNIITYYYMENCGYCKAFNPEWEKFTKKYKSNPHLKIKKIDSGADFKDEHTKLVKGYPTVILDKNDFSKPILFEGDRDRTLDGLEKFLKENGINMEDKARDMFTENTDNEARESNADM